MPRCRSASVSRPAASPAPKQALARDRAKLHDTELEVVNQLTYVVSDLEADYQTTVTNFNRRAAAERNLRDVQAAYDLNKDVVPYDVPLQAQRTLASAESDYFRSLTNYAKAISQVHRIKGSLLEYNGVFLAEGPWPAKAYFDARRRARCPRGGREHRLRLYLSAAGQPRGVQAVQRPTDGRRGDACDGAGPTPSRRRRTRSRNCCPRRRRRPARAWSNRSFRRAARPRRATRPRQAARPSSHRRAMRRAIWCDGPERPGDDCASRLPPSRADWT